MLQNNRIDFIDFLNVICCIAVIALHCNGCFWKFSYQPYWKTSVIIECLFYFAVPCFFMITGATLIDYRCKYNTKTYFIKRVKKAVVPFLFWSIVWLITTRGYNNSNYLQIIESIVNTKPQHVYWFFIPLFSIYLAIPVLSLIENSSRKRAYLYLIGLSGIFVSTLPKLFSAMHIKYNGALTNLAAGGYLIYVLLGYTLLNYINLDLKKRLLIYGIGFMGLLIRGVTVYLWSLEKGKIDNTLGGTIGFPTVFYAVAIFVFFQYDFEQLVSISERIKRHIRILSSYSFGIYLIHMFFVIKIPKFFHFSNTSIIWRTIGVICVYLLCIVTVLVLKKIPVIRKFVP